MVYTNDISRDSRRYIDFNKGRRKIPSHYSEKELGEDLAFAKSRAGEF